MTMYSGVQARGWSGQSQKGVVISNSAGCGDGGCAAQGYKGASMVRTAAGNRVLAGWRLGAACRSGHFVRSSAWSAVLPGGFETVSQFQGQGWDREGVARADHHHSFHRTHPMLKGQVEATISSVGTAEAGQAWKQQAGDRRNGPASASRACTPESAGVRPRPAGADGQVTGWSDQEFLGLMLSDDHQRCGTHECRRSEHGETNGAVVAHTQSQKPKGKETPRHLPSVNPEIWPPVGGLGPLMEINPGDILPGFWIRVTAKRASAAQSGRALESEGVRKPELRSRRRWWAITKTEKNKKKIRPCSRSHSRRGDECSVP